jgi:hypothetical protein
MTHACQNNKLIAVFTAGLLVSAVAGVLAAEPAPWTVPTSRLRLHLELEPVSPWPATAAQCQLSPGTVPPEQAKVTVTRTDGTPVSSSVLWARQGQPLTLVFDTASGATSLFAYVETGPEPAAGAWRPQAGVLLETRLLDRPAFESRAQFDAAWAGSTGIYGRSFSPDIFEGVHPHGPAVNFLGRYEAWFRIDKAGEYAFATLSDDASFLSIDGKPVAEWPGIHGTDAGRYAEKRGQLPLEPGLHLLRYDLAQNGGLMTAVASWRKPGMRHFEVMPPQAFAPVARFVCQAADAPAGAPAPAHFDWRLTRSVRLDRALVAGAAFRAMPVPDATYDWSFGDGTHGEGDAPEHAYIGPGRRLVRLEVRPARGSPVVLEQPVDIFPVWRQVEECPDSALVPLKDAVWRRKPFGSLSMPELETVVIFANALGDRILLNEVGSECLIRKTGFLPGFSPYLYEIGLTFRHPEYKKYVDADAMFSLALAHVDGPETNAWRARITVTQAETRLNGLRNPESARAALDTLRDDTLDGFSRRQKHLLTADALMSQGRKDEALRLCRSLPPSETGTLAAIHLQSRLTAAADYVRREEWEAAVDMLESIMTDFPSVRFGGNAGLLLMDARAGRGSMIPAIVLGERLLNADLLDDARAGLLLRLSRLHRTLGDKAAAARYRDMLKKEFPYSEASAIVGTE